MQAAGTFTVSSVDRALDILELLVRCSPLRLSDAARELGISPSTAHRLLAMLCKHGYAVQDGQRRYVRGPALAETIGPAPAADALLEVGMAALMEGSRVVDDTIHLMTLDGPSVRVLASVRAEANPSGFGDRTGLVRPAHRSAGGRALLAELDRQTLATLYRTTRPRPSPFDQFHGSLDQVRRRGYAENTEDIPYVVAVAVPLRDRSGRAYASLTVCSPPALMPPWRRRHVVLQLQACAATVQQLPDPFAGRTLGEALD